MGAVIYSFVFPYSIFVFLYCDTVVQLCVCVCGVEFRWSQVCLAMVVFSVLTFLKLWCFFGAVQTNNFHSAAYLWVNPTCTDHLHLSETIATWTCHS